MLGRDLVVGLRSEALCRGGGDGSSACLWGWGGLRIAAGSLKLL